MRLAAGLAAEGTIIIRTRGESKSEGPKKGGHDGRVVVARTEKLKVGKGGHGEDIAQPHSPFVQNHSDTMAQPPIRNMMLGAVCDGQRVDVGTLPQRVRWKHVSVTDVVRIDDVYTAPNAEPAGVLDRSGTKWMECSVYASVTLTSGAQR